MQKYFKDKYVNRHLLEKGLIEQKGFISQR